MENLIGVSSTTYVGHSFENVVKSVSQIGLRYLELVSAPGTAKGNKTISI